MLTKPIIIRVVLKDWC